MCSISAPRLRGDDEVVIVRWDCPRGHHESDQAPLRERVFCLTCNDKNLDPWYDREDVTVRGGAREREAAYANA